MKKIFGFSLVEIVVALIIFSVITAALAPIITKKLKSNNVTVGSLGGGGTLQMDCKDKFGPECGLCYPDKCVSCVKSCLSNQTLNIGKCDCEDCSAIHQAVCLRCDNGGCTECTTPNYISDGDCTICPIGSYCDGTSKTVCPNGKYTDTTGQTVCKNCEAGYYCTGGEKKECTAGKYSEANSSSCATCPKGYYCPPKSNKIQCSGNKYQPNEGKDSCLTCSAGSYVTSDRAQCLVCEAGYKCTGDGSKVACGAGTYQPHPGQTDCLTCPAGYTCSGANQTYCQAGSYAPSAGSTSCTTCPKGYYCTGGTNKTACGSGKYNDLTGQGAASACKSCSSKTANCATCNLETGTCTGCNSGYKVDGSSCIPEKNELLFTFTGTYSETVNAQGKQKIYLKSGGELTALNSANVTLFLVGGGGGGAYYNGGGGGGGYTYSTSLRTNTNQSYVVSIGIGGIGGSVNPASDGYSTKFSNFSAPGGKYGNGAIGGDGTGKGGLANSVGQDGIQFDGEWFGGGGGGGGMDDGVTYVPGGKGGGGRGAPDNNSGEDGVRNTGGGGGGGGAGGNYGGNGGSGVVIILVN